MANTEHIEMLKDLIRETLEKMTFADFTIDAREGSSADGESIVFNIGSSESDLLIGQYGVNLQALQHILRAMARKKTEELLRFSVDVNNYHQEKIRSLEELAKSAAKQVAAEKRPIVLRPMSPYERRIIHLTLSVSDQVKTESIGDEEERKVVIKPVGNIEQADDLKSY